MSASKLPWLSTLSCICCSANLYGNPFDSDEAMHAVGHTGGSYVLTHTTEVICKKLAGPDHKTACLLVGAGVAMTAGIVKEVVLDKGESNKRHFKGYTEDAVGIGLAAAIVTIDW